MEYNTKANITKFDVDWLAIKDACMQTISKQAKTTPQKEWRRKLIISRHSPIRRGIISWKWDNIPFYVMGHYVRHHVATTPYVSTSRSDRSDVTDRSERRQTDNVSMQVDTNVQGLIDMAEKRLCTQSDTITREYMEALKDEIAKYDEDVAWALAPSGIYKCGCPEKFGNCTYCTNILKQIPQEDLFDIEKRLDYYNAHREKVKVKKL